MTYLLCRVRPVLMTFRTMCRSDRDWNAGKIRVLFAHPASAGHGLSLQKGGNILVFFGHNWNLEEFQQMIERSPCFYRKRSIKHALEWSA